MVELSGTFVTRVFEGPYRDMANWVGEMEQLVQDSGRHLETLYFFYPTCPKCAKVYGHNYVVGVARVGSTPA